MADRAKYNRLPDFIGIGPARTGTTWLDAVLRGHAGLPRGIKETDFFDRYYAKGIAWYAWHFRDCDSSLPVGEICPTYFPLAQAPGRIARHIPACKMICTLRDPADRAYSHYKVLRYRGVARVTFEEALAVHFQVIEGSRSAFHLAGWQQRFGKDNVLVTFYDDLCANPQGYVDSICDFIGIGRIPLDRVRIGENDVNMFKGPALHHRRAQNGRHLLRRLQGMHAYRLIDFLDRVGVWDSCFGGGPAFEPLPPEIEARVRERFRPEVAALEELTGRDLSAWKAPRENRRETASAGNGAATPARATTPGAPAGGAGWSEPRTPRRVGIV